MKRLDSKKALELLFKDVILSNDDLEKEENRWIKHCLYVGIAAGRIADVLGLDSDYAIALGYVHDIGRKISHPNHVIEGYKYMVKHGFSEEARSCVTHSFIDNNIYYVAGTVLKSSDKIAYMNKFLSDLGLNTYDNVIQLCDLFCLETGFTTLEKRLLDIYTRKGVFENTKAHLEKVMELRARLEKAMECSLYELFPEIDATVLDQVNQDYDKLIDLLNNNLIDFENKLIKKSE